MDEQQNNTTVVIAEKTFHKGALYGHVSSGNGVIALGNGKGIKFTAINEKFIIIQLLEYGIGVPIKTQSWQKVKKEVVTVVKEVPQKKLIDEIQFKVSDEKEVLF